MISEKSTRLPRRVIAMSAALVLVALVWIGGRWAGDGHAAGELGSATDHRAGAR